MGTYIKGVLGGFSGKVGPVIGVRWRGKNVMRSLPTPSNLPPTEAQEVQRIKFSRVSKFLFPLRQIIGMFFGQPTADKSRYNLATSYHLKEAVTVVNNVGEIDYSKVLISRGDLQGVQGTTLAAAANQVLQLSWTDNSGQPMANATDQLYVVCYAPTQNWYELFTPAGERQDASITVTLPNYFVGETVQVWATFVNINAGIAATSSYLGTATIV